MDGAFDSPVETLSLASAPLSNPAQGQLVWTGSTTLNGCKPSCGTFTPHSIQTRVRLTLLSGTSGTTRVALDSPPTVGIPDPQVGGVVSVKAGLTNFRAQIEVLASDDGGASFMPAATLFNSYNNAGPNLLRMSFTGAFWYENNPPKADIGFDASLQTTGTAITFTGTSSDFDGSVKSIGWDFNNDGQFQESTQPVAQWTFPKAGSFPVRFRVIDNENDVTVAAKTLVIKDKPVVVQPPVITPGPVEPQLIPSTVANNWLAFPKFTKVKGLSVSNLLAATTVKVSCKTKKKKQQKKGCPYKSKRFTTSGARAKLNLLKPFKKKKLPIGTKITISVTVPGQIGKRFSYTMRKRKIPKKALACLPPSGGTSSCA
jgi:PKD repeat protein